MKIGVVGLGIVGKAIRFGFTSIGHEVKSHDIKQDTRIEDLLDTEIVYLCVPTLCRDDGSCDTAIVESVIDELIDLNYEGIIAIKSTVEPGFTLRMIKKHSNPNICFVPEFLRERCAITDFMEKHDVCIIGTDEGSVFQKVKKSHGKLPQNFVATTTTEAELCKYFNNTFNAALITFANSFYEICNSLGVNYQHVKDAIVLREHIKDIYLDCNVNLRGFGGQCLPKDTKALDALCRKLNNVKLFGCILEENDKYATTVFEGMRDE